MNIQPATISNQTQIKKLHLSAFGEEENQVVAQLAVDLLSESDVISLIAVEGDKIAGHVAFSPVKVNENSNYRGHILAPLAVHPNFQKSGVGSSLIKEGLDRIQKESADFVLVYGDPAYYSKFGFTPKAAESFLPPFELQYPFGWQAIVWNSKESSPVQIQCVEPLNDPEMW